MGGILGDDMGLGKTMQVCLKLFDYMEIGLLSEIT
jgi:SNF2 family DNA or RNA helicase